MAALAETSIFRKITALGPIKMEIIHTDLGSDADTITSTLANPMFVMAFESFAGAPTLRATMVDSTKVITVDTCAGSNGSCDYTVLVFGF